MLRLKANKTSLYKLVAEYEALPSTRRVTFTKAYRQLDYWLKWTDADGLLCVAFLATCLGKPLLSIEKKEFGGPQVSRAAHGGRAGAGAGRRTGVVQKRQGKNSLPFSNLYLAISKKL